MRNAQRFVASSSLLGAWHSLADSGNVSAVRAQVTTGADKTLRLWNHVERRVELCREFGEDVHSASLHPSGELLLLGCATRLRMYTVLAEDIR